MGPGSSKNSEKFLEPQKKSGVWGVPIGKSGFGDSLENYGLDILRLVDLSQDILRSKKFLENLRLEFFLIDAAEQCPLSHCWQSGEPRMLHAGP